MSLPKQPGSDGRNRKNLARTTFVSFGLAGVVLTINGFLLPWNEEGVLFALYGASVGFALALSLSALGLWLTRKDKNR